VDRLQQQWASLSAELQDCRTADDMLRAEHAANQQALDSRLSELLQLAQEAQAKDELTTALKAARDEIKRRTAKDGEVLSAEYATLEARFVDAEEARAETEHDLRAARRDVVEAQQKIEQLTTEKDRDAEKASSDFFEMSEALDDAQRRLDEALATVREAKRDSEQTEAKIRELRVEGSALRSQWLAMHGRIEALLAQLQTERNSGRGQDELDAVKEELTEMRKGVAAQNPQKYARELAEAIAALDVDKVKQSLADGAKLKRIGVEDLLLWLVFPRENQRRDRAADFDQDAAIAIIDLLTADNQSFGKLFPKWDKLVQFPGNPETLKSKTFFIYDAEGARRFFNAKVVAHARKVGFFVNSYEWWWKFVNYIYELVWEIGWSKEHKSFLIDVIDEAIGAMGLTKPSLQVLFWQYYNATDKTFKLPNEQFQMVYDLYVEKGYK
jgi:chromosome segregation ATPase